MKQEADIAVVEKVPMRTCIACQQKRSKEELCRIVRCAAGKSTAAGGAGTKPVNGAADAADAAKSAPAVKLKLDESGKVAGRGAYVCYDKACFKKMKEKGLLAARLRCKVKKQDYERLESDFEVALLKR